MAEYQDSDDGGLCYDSYEEDGCSEEGDDDQFIDLGDGEASQREHAQFCYTVLTPEKIQDKMFGLVDEVRSVFELPRPVVRVLLSHLRWDKEELMSRYFSGDRQTLFEDAHLVWQQKQELSLPKLTVQCGASATPVHEVLCEICFCSYEKNEMSGLECGHLFCLDCWNQYLTTCVMEEGKAETISCPAANCGVVVDECTVLRIIQDASVRGKYRYLITNSFVQANRTLKWCPSPGCGNAVMATDREEQGVHCHCGKDFCFGCQRDPHEPITCDFLTKWLKKCDDEGETANWLHINTKGCPKCHAAIEKSGGCNHMTCRNISCKAEFCWVCLGPWDQHGSSWYNCNRFNESDSKVARESQSKSRAQLARYLFYCNRYLNHAKSRRLEHKLFSMAKEKRAELEAMDVPQVETQFLHQAVDVLCHCRNTLMYTYAFAFYLVKNNQCMIFEDNQGDLEMATECLSEYLETDVTKAAFQKLKVDVLDKSKYCEARRKALLQHVYEGYAQGLWEFGE